MSPEPRSIGVDPGPHLSIVESNGYAREDERKAEKASAITGSGFTSTSGSNPVSPTNFAPRFLKDREAFLLGVDLSRRQGSPVIPAVSA
jgi:hypothetical protein